jgi:hypothetical protein
VEYGRGSAEMASIPLGLFHSFVDVQPFNTLGFVASSAAGGALALPTSCCVSFRGLPMVHNSFRLIVLFFSAAIPYTSKKQQMNLLLCKILIQAGYFFFV